MNRNCLLFEYPKEIEERLLFIRMIQFESEHPVLIRLVNSSLLTTSPPIAEIARGRSDLWRKLKERFRKIKSGTGGDRTLDLEIMRLAL